MTLDEVSIVKALGYKLEPDDEVAFAAFVSTKLKGLELAQLLTQYEVLFGPYSTSPEKKSVRFSENPNPWFRIQFYSDNYLDDVNGLVLARIFRYDQDKLIAEHEYFILPERARGQKLAKKILAVSLEQYEQMNVKEIRVWAGLKDGGAVWAKIGFKALDRTEMDAILRIAKTTLTGDLFHVIQGFYNLYYNAEPEGISFPIQDWADLDFMGDVLRQVDWHGWIDLTNPDELLNFKKYVTR